MPYQLWILFSIIGWGVGSFLYKFANSELSPIMVSSIALGFYLALTPLLWLFVKFDHTITTAGIIYTLVGSLFMCVGTLGFSYALRNGGAAGSTTALCALYPALTLALSCLFLAEPFTFKKGIGMTLALLSFVLLATK